MLCILECSHAVSYVMVMARQVRFVCTYGWDSIRVAKPQEQDDARLAQPRAERRAAAQRAAAAEILNRVREEVATRNAMHARGA